MNRHSPRGRPTGCNHWRQTRAIGHKGSKIVQGKAKWQSFIICTPKRVYTGLFRAIWRPVDTENAVRIENAGFRSVREIIIVSTMTPFFIALLALVTSTFRTRAAQQPEIVALR